MPQTGDVSLAGRPLRLRDLVAPLALAVLAVIGPVVGELLLSPFIATRPDWVPDAYLRLDRTIDAVSAVGAFLIATGLTRVLWVVEGRRVPSVADHLRQSVLTYGLAIAVLLPRLVGLPETEGGMKITIIECFSCRPSWDVTALAVVTGNAVMLAVIHARQSAA